jgi:antitoxin HigA-1
MVTAHAPIHPGEILLEEFLSPLGISQYRLAHAIGVPPRRVNEIVHGKRAISPDTALRLSRALGTSHIQVLDEPSGSLRPGHSA